ncbi:Ig-like domain-containing protein [Phototrophicus methaneseepsis]|uniref:Ig-like domain-containing protein n=1 Tax=Phototrophicus methaneseepsis TaxID=2710758 RepID=A0A7S8IEQ2_9CHLR|nr:Ig-like domain-containing protein [Phototrophicus methaneseepsis]QPC82831.1 Ig-like domain-containing protein [Phototrophicus methaneseepsis]
MKQIFILVLLFFSVLPLSAQDTTPTAPTPTQEEIEQMEAEGIDYTDHPILTTAQLEGLQAITPQAAPTSTSLYWTDQLTDSVGTVSLDGSTLDILVSGSGGTPPDNARSVAIDPAGDANGPKVYWSSSNSTPSGIFRMNLDGTNVEHIIDLSSPWAIAIDPVNDLLYVSDINNNALYRADLYGTAIGSGGSINTSLQQIHTGTNADFIEHIELDVPNNTIYWASFAGDDNLFSASLAATPLTGITTLCTAVSAPRYFYRDVTHDTIFISNADGLYRTDDINCTGNTTTTIINGVSGRGIAVDQLTGVGYMLESTNDALWSFDPAGVNPTSILRTDATTWDTPIGLAVLYTDTAPAVTNAAPMDGASGVPLEAAITLTFDESVALQAASVTLECPVGANVSFSISPLTASETFTLTPDAVLPDATTCTLTIPAASVTDTDNYDTPNTLAADFVMSFTTLALPTPTVQPTVQPTSVPGPAATAQPEVTAVPLEDLGVTELPSTGERPLWAQWLRALLGLLD